MTATFDKIRDLFDLPATVVKNDSVVKLHDGIANAAPARTLEPGRVPARLVRLVDVV